MDFRTKRQLAVILLILFIIVVPAAYLIYRSIPQPTCFDNIRNQDEEDIDCGGPCLPCALKHPEDLVVFWTRYVGVQEGVYDVAAEVGNPNIKLGAADFEYVFRLYDQDGVLVGERAGRSFIFPGETIHIVESNIGTQRILKNITLTIRNINWVFTDKLPPDIVLGGKELAVDSSRKSSRLTATLINRSLTDFKDVFLTALILDASGNIIAVNRVIERDLRSGESRPVVFLWPIAFDEQNPSIIIEARVNTLAK